MRARTPFVGQTTPFESPLDKETKFAVRRLGNREVLAYRDKNSVVRFISEENEGSDRYIQEKDYPAGTMRVDTVVLGLASWNLTDPDGAPISLDEKVARDNILSYLDPVELDFLYEQVLELNPILTGREARKND